MLTCGMSLRRGMASATEALKQVQEQVKKRKARGNSSYRSSFWMPGEVYEAARNAGGAEMEREGSRWEANFRLCPLARGQRYRFRIREALVS